MDRLLHEYGYTVVRDAELLYWVDRWVVGGRWVHWVVGAWRVGGNPLTNTNQTHLFAAVRTAGLL